ncbi:hypothetical protein Ddc_13320 [Ditylenchus destructor]|nr:hypothetical protein Ddc_13320 [Ditylenchus destructor]
MNQNNGWPRSNGNCAPPKSAQTIKGWVKSIAYFPTKFISQATGEISCVYVQREMDWEKEGIWWLGETPFRAGTNLCLNDYFGERNDYKTLWRLDCWCLVFECAGNGKEKREIDWEKKNVCRNES